MDRGVKSNLIEILTVSGDSITNFELRDAFSELRDGAGNVASFDAFKDAKSRHLPVLWVTRHNNVLYKDLILVMNGGKCKERGDWRWNYKQLRGIRNAPRLDPVSAGNSAAAGSFGALLPFLS